MFPVFDLFVFFSVLKVPYKQESFPPGDCKVALVFFSVSLGLRFSNVSVEITLTSAPVSSLKLILFRPSVNVSLHAPLLSFLSATEPMK